MSITTRSNKNNIGITTKKILMKNEAQATFYNTKYNKTKRDNMADTFQDLGLISKSQVINSNDKKDLLLPAIKPNEGFDSSKDFQITNNEIKNRITLDKVLGSGFKKIDIYDANLKEFENKEFYQSGSMFGDKINKISDSEAGYEYDDFEILESENEEDPKNESNNYTRDVSTKRQKQEDRSVDMKNSTFVQNDIDDIRDRINKKYKSKHKVTIFKKNTFKTAKSSEYEQMKYTNAEDSYMSSVTQDNQQNQKESSRLLDLNDNNQFESKSLSPKCMPEMRKSRFQDTNTVFGVKSKLFGGETNGFNSSKLSFYAGNTHTSNFGFGSDSTYRGTNNFKNRSESFKIEEKEGIKHSRNLSSKPLNGDDKYRTSYAFNSEKFSETSFKFFTEKLQNGSQIEHKYVKENQITTEKLKQDEKNFLDKYAKKFNFNTEEGDYLILIDI